MIIVNGEQTFVKFAERVVICRETRCNDHLSGGIDISRLAVSHKTEQRIGWFTSDAPNGVAPFAGPHRDHRKKNASHETEKHSAFAGVIPDTDHTHTMVNQ